MNAMLNPYDIALRERAVAGYGRGEGSYAQLAGLFDVDIQALTDGSGTMVCFSCLKVEIHGRTRKHSGGTGSASEKKWGRLEHRQPPIHRLSTDGQDVESAKNPIL